MAGHKVQYTLLVFAAVASIGDRLHPATFGQTPTFAFGLAAAAAMASFLALDGAALIQLQGRRASLASSAIAGLVLRIE